MRVLIADDHPDSSQWLGALVECWGYEPVIVQDGRAALASLRASAAPTLAVLDWIMPGMNGIEICREIRKDSGRPYTYVVLVTGKGGKEQMLDGMEAGADDYLVKPVDANELHARLSAGKRIAALQDQLLATQRLLKEQATRDALTGIWNRAMIWEILERELARSAREGQPVSVIMADIDHFKHINDTHGHIAGDRVLREAAQRLLGALRPYDTVGRYGGEEFLVVLPGCDADAGLALAERLRDCVATEPISDEGSTIFATLSLGVATWDGQTRPDELLRAADAALYGAKRAGRDRVVSA